MLKKIVVGGGVVMLVAGLGLFLWARSVLTGDSVRVAVASQLGKALGQPVTIGGLGATIWPRVTMTLHDVTIGQPARITAKELYVGTEFRALLSRRIEHAVVRLAGARIVLPLPAMAGDGSTDSGDASAKPPVEIVSVDEIAVTDVEVVSGKRTLRGDVVLVPQGSAVDIRKAVFGADRTTLSLTGRISNLDGPVGDLTLDARGLNFDELLAFVTDFAASAGGGTLAAPARASAPRAAPAAVAPMNLSVSITADRATFGSLALEKLAGRARITAGGIRLDPVRFGVFSGTCDGVLGFTLSDTPEFQLKANLSGIDLVPVMIFAGQPGAMTGRLSGAVDVTGRGLEVARVLESTQGTARVEIKDGSVKGLGLVRGVVLATSMRPGATAAAVKTSTSEPFSRLGATFSITNGSATTQDLHFESPDVLLSAVAAIRLDGSAVAVTGPVQLSDELTKQAGRDLVRLTQKDGRVTVPASVTGPLDQLQVRIDVGDMTKRAVGNAGEELLKALQKKIGRGGGGE